MKFRIAVLFFLIAPLAAVCQVAQGLVQDAETHEPMPFVSIGVEGLYLGTVSNQEGRFQLDLSEVSSSDMVVFSHVGYESLRLEAGQVTGMSTFEMKQTDIKLLAVQVLSEKLTTRQILERVMKNYSKNYPVTPAIQQGFLHRLQQIRFNDEGKIHAVESDFEHMDKQKLNAFFKQLPEEFVENQEALMNLYTDGENVKTEPLKGISLQEGSMKDLEKEVKSVMREFMKDVDATSDHDDTYFKMQSGIFGIDLNMGEERDSIRQEMKRDTIHHVLPSNAFEVELKRVFKEYATLDGKNWEFISKSSRYQYTEPEVNVINEVLVYEIHFQPRQTGVFEGVMYINVQDYAVMEMDYRFASGKQSDKINLLGVSHLTNDKQCRVIYEKQETGYFLKYIKVHQEDYASVDRDLSFKKKQKRFLWDKELNVAKMKLNLMFDTESDWEFLVLSRSAISAEAFENFKSPPFFKFDKQYTYSNHSWGNKTIIAPTAELEKFERKSGEGSK